MSTIYGWSTESTYLFLSTPTLMPSSMSVGATLSARSTTNLANCFTLMMYLAIFYIIYMLEFRGKDGDSFLLGVIRVSIDDLSASCDLATDCVCDLH